MFLLLILTITFSLGAKIPEPCCSRKTVGDLSYTLVNSEDTSIASRYGCISNCVYQQDDLPGSLFCFAVGDLPTNCTGAVSVPTTLKEPTTTTQSAITTEETGSWVLGPQGSGDCHAACSLANAVCDESMGQLAASDPENVQFEGIDCQGLNKWGYGQGFSQCTDATCCGDGSCQYHCSLTSSWPGCKMEDGFAEGDHSRICPCTMSTAATTTTDTPTGSCSCGKANSKMKIVGGHATEENEFPWMVGLLTRESSSYPICGGTLISEKDVLTSAHCVNSDDMIQYVVLGEHNLEDPNDGQKKVRVCSVKKHPNYDAKTADYDFAIVTLCESVSFTTDISPACLPSSSSNEYEHVVAVVTGWGTLTNGGILPDVLHGAGMYTMTNSQCTGDYTDYSSSDITDRMLCASYFEAEACQGDNGGPLVTKESTNFYTVIGITSWGVDCANVHWNPRYPGVYARVTNQLTWIKSNSEGNFCAGR